MMSLLAMSSVSRKAGRGGGRERGRKGGRKGEGEVGSAPKGCKTAWPCLRSALERPHVVGTGCAASLFPCTNGLRKQPALLLCRTPISGSEAFSQSGQAVDGREL